MDVRLLRLERSHPADTFSPWKIVKPEYGGLSISDAHVTTVQYPTIQYNDDQLVARANIASCLAEVFSSDDGRLAKIDGWTGWEVYQIGPISDTDPHEPKKEKVQVIILRKQVPASESKAESTEEDFEE